MDAILALGHVLKETAERTRAHDGFGCAKLVAFANAPSDNPFMAGAFHGPGEPRSEEHTSELQSLRHLVCRLLLEKKKITETHVHRNADGVQNTRTKPLPPPPA